MSNYSYLAFIKHDIYRVSLQQYSYMCFTHLQIHGTLAYIGNTSVGRSTNGSFGQPLSFSPQHRLAVLLWTLSVSWWRVQGRARSVNGHLAFKSMLCLIQSPGTFAWDHSLGRIQHALTGGTLPEARCSIDPPSGPDVTPYVLELYSE